MANGWKARGVSGGPRGQRTDHVNPKPKPIVEINWWVFVVKLKTGLGASIGISVGAFVGWLATGGAAIGAGGTTFIVWAVIMAFIFGYLQPGDRETAPPGETFPKGLHPNR